MKTSDSRKECEHSLIEPAIGSREPVICLHCAKSERQIKEEVCAAAAIANFIKNKLEEIPAHYQNAGFDTFNENYRLDKMNEPQKAVNGRLKALRVCRDYVDNFEEKLKTGGGLVLSGGHGTGKTYLSFCIFRAITESGKIVTRRTINRLLMEVKGAYSPRDKYALTAQQVMDSFVVPDLLIIDEVGRQEVDSPHERKLTDDIFGERYEKNKPTILISNCKTEGFKDSIGENIWSRFGEHGKRILFEWEDAR